MITVIICTFNPRLEYLQRTIASIKEQTLRRSDYELLVVDNNSREPVAGLQIVRDLSIRVVVEKKQGLNAARESGSRNAKGDILVFVDDDNVLASDYLEKVSSLFQDPRIGVVGGQIEPEYEEEPGGYFRSRVQQCLALREFPADRLYLTSSPPVNGHFPIGAGMCVRTSILRSYYAANDGSNPITGRLGNSLSSGEDIDIDLFVISQGHMVGVTNDLRLKHLIPRDRIRYRYIINLKKAQLLSSYQLSKKWSIHLGMEIFPIFSTPALLALLKALIAFLLFPLHPWKFGISFHNNFNLMWLLLKRRFTRHLKGNSGKRL